MSLLTCPLCGKEQDASGPGVSSGLPDPSGVRTFSWNPFIEDLRGTPTRLVHPRCFADEAGFDALIALITAHDRSVSIELSKLRRTRSAGPTDLGGREGEGVRG